MEKRKVYKISIIDKEISRTEFDRNTFYTSDSELTLVFKLIERDYSYDQGEILLYNENDKSFVTREIKKQENDFVYELDLDIIPHYGKWKAQLQLVNDGDVYTSKPFDFSIVNDLSNLAPQPTLTDINNWSTLKNNAAELIDEMVTVIDDIKKYESQHENAEIKRQQGESERVSKENLRQQGEFARVENETTRQQAESQRQSIFETNETERQTTFETAEKERQSAELIRVENEEQRKTDHANRSAELAGKANKKQEDWITPTLANGWVSGASNAPRFRKDDFGNVYVTGTFAEGSGTIFTLPQGYRPIQIKVFIVNAGGGFGILRVTQNGVVSLLSGSGTYIIADNVIFSVD